MGERRSDGRIITGAPTDVKGEVPFVTKEGKARLKDEMYQDFLLHKSKGDIAMDYRFDTWCNRAKHVLETIRKQHLKAEFEMGKIGRAESAALEEMRLKMIEAIKEFDFTTHDMYGIQHLDLSLKDAEMRVQETDEVLRKKEVLTPTHRPGVVKTKPAPKGQVIPMGGKGGSA